MKRHERMWLGVPARPGWRDRWVQVREMFAEFLVLVGLIVTFLGILVAATLRDVP